MAFSDKLSLYLLKNSKEKQKLNESLASDSYITYRNNPDNANRFGWAKMSNYDNPANCKFASFNGKTGQWEFHNNPTDNIMDDDNVSAVTYPVK